MCVVSICFALMRSELSQVLARAVKYLLVVYTVLSLAFTARHFYSSHSTSINQDPAPIYPRADDEFVIPRPQQPLAETDLVDASVPAQPPVEKKAAGHTVVWTSEEGAYYKGENEKNKETK